LSYRYALRIAQFKYQQGPTLIRWERYQRSYDVNETVDLQPALPYEHHGSVEGA
jgi:hypothetical protein